jgi:hypothetical protein
MLRAIRRRPEAIIGFKFKHVRAGAPKSHLQTQVQIKNQKRSHDPSCYLKATGKTAMKKSSFHLSLIQPRA